MKTDSPDSSPDIVVPVPPGTLLDFTRRNPLQRLVDLVAGTRLAAERHAYLTEHLHYLFPFESLELAGPAGSQWQEVDPSRQNDKTDIQKQLVRDFHTSEASLVRGWATAGDWTGPFLRVSYDGGPDSRLSAFADHHLGPAIKMWLKVGDRAAVELLSVPYNPETNRYDIELWGYSDSDLDRHLDDRGRRAFERGEIVQRPDLIQGAFGDFLYDSAEDWSVSQISPGHAMHPVLPLPVEIAWCDAGARWWDSREGANHRYEFNMIVRGRFNHFAGGNRSSLFGGIGASQFRTLFASESPRSDPSFTVEDVNWLSLRSDSGIGIHRHRDNQDVYLVLQGRALAIVGDWRPTPSRERCFEVRTIRSGDMVFIKPGALHGLLNPTDTDINLLSFGGPD